MARLRPSKEEILEQYRACERKLGRSPGVARFCKTAGVAVADVKYYWARPGDLTREAGGTPNEFQSAIPENELFGDYARVCLDLGKIPTEADLRIATRRLGTRTHALRHRFGSTLDRNRKFRLWLEDGPAELKSILDLPGWQRTGRVKTLRPAATPITFHPLLPAALQYLDALARGELPPHDTTGESVNVLFERRCGTAFQAMGFEVQQLGQGKGRAADLLAVTRPFRYGVIVDAKVRRDGYVLTTDDRTFYEYVKTHTAQLRQDGLDKVYLAVIGSGFRESDINKLAEYLAGSEVRGVTFFTASALMRIVEESIRDRARFSLGDFEKTLFGNRVVSS